MSKLAEETSDLQSLISASTHLKEIDLPKIARTSDFSSDESIDLNSNIESLKVKYLECKDAD